ncbi:hypothetical protein LOAG_05184 [Loa loa]|uniref:MAM domain-containing protein n=1 Tax=Loa loa TaxID=7209 RepID=A0A1S0U0U7_LOALO|nr:hypothetical protein LOAG_05184 [Loa loa]EFO23305.1 hypothetical protein LOAG_05184 [Loa loa]
MSADLNCDFQLACQWRNYTAGEDNGDFLIASNVRLGNRFNIISSKNNSNELFAYTHGPFDGIQKATLISNIISCQLGGGTLTFWYYRTGDSATLEVCVRQPPGSLNVADLRCFPVFPKNRAHQWLFNAVEFPPLTQPFELLIRSNYIQPFDVIAIDDIFYDAALCERGVNKSIKNGHRRQKNPVIAAWLEGAQCFHYTSHSAMLTEQANLSSYDTRRTQRKCRDATDNGSLLNKLNLDENRIIDFLNTGGYLKILGLAIVKHQ